MKIGHIDSSGEQVGLMLDRLDYLFSHEEALKRHEKRRLGLSFLRQDGLDLQVFDVGKLVTTSFVIG